MMANDEHLQAEVERLTRERDHYRTAAERMGYGETGWPRVFALQDEMAALERQNLALRRQYNAMREIVQEMAYRPLSYNPVLIPPRFQCNHCDASTGALEVVDGRIYQVTSDMAAPRVQHTPDCPITKARALLAQQAE